ncbi:hypothetical protein [Tardiphaga sp. P9-11]|nr:hypothetical protein [Tardiphaga sp. P9-11]
MDSAPFLLHDLRVALIDQSQSNERKSPEDDADLEIIKSVPAKAGH